MRVPRPRFARLAFAALLLVSLVALAGCESSDPQNTFDPQGSVADQIQDLFLPIGAIAIAILVGVWGAILIIVLRFRRRPDGELPRQTHGNTRLEIAWTLAPTLLMAAIAVPTILTVFDLADTPDDAMQVRVTANQWWWEFEYPDLDLRTANELHIPTDQPVELTLESNDVIHSFWVPKLAGKQDVVPNHTNEMWIEADEAGVYSGQCAEYCGLSHALMRFRVVAQPPEEFEAWVEAQRQEAEEPQDDLAREGQDLFLNGEFFPAGAQAATNCAACHTVTGTEAGGRVGPDLTHFASRETLAAGILDQTPENIAKWLRNPADVKPGALMPDLNLSEDEIDALVAYLLSLE